MTNFSIQKNITALYIIKIAKWMNFVMPVIVLFYNSNDMTMQDIFTLKAIYSFTLMFFEIPTGYFADVIGRRTSILLGTVLGVAGFLIYSFSFGFFQFVLAEIALGISMSLVSGADSAMLYDTLKAGNQQEKYIRIEGRISSAGNFGEALAGIIGGMIAVYSLRTPFFIQTAVSAMAIPAALMLREPKVFSKQFQTGFMHIPKIIKEALQINKKLKWTILLSSAIGASTLTMAWFAQPYFIMSGMEVAWFGVGWAVLNIAAGLGAFHAWRIEHKVGSKVMVIIIVAILATSFIAMSFAPLLPGFLILLIFYIFRGLATPTLRNYINNLTESGVRATVMSLRNFLIRLIFAVLGPFFGWLTDAYSLQTALMVTGILFGLISGITLLFFLKNMAHHAGN